MNNFNNNRSGGSRGGSRGGYRSDNRGGRSNFGSRDSRPSEMHDAVCAECGKNCQIPFFPRSGKPVFCSDCFEKQNSNGGNRRSDDRRSSYSDRRDSNDRRSNYSERRDSKPRNDRPSVDYKEQFEIVNSKLDKVLRLVEKMERNSKPQEPRAERPDKVKTVAEIIAQSIDE